MDPYNIVATIFFFFSVGFTIKTFIVLRMGDVGLATTGMVASTICWTITAVFAGWLG